LIIFLAMMFKITFMLRISDEQAVLVELEFDDEVFKPEKLSKNMPRKFSGRRLEYRL